jgi:signal peptidase I
MVLRHSPVQRYVTKDMAEIHSDPTKPESFWQKNRWIVENVTSLFFALFLVFMIRSSVIEAFKIPSGSMLPTLLIGDHIFVNKFAYGFKVPFTDWFLDEPLHIVKRDPPKRGDIIVIMYPRDESFYYIKRVVGVPGDTIEVRNKVLYVNDQEMARAPIATDESTQILETLDDPRYTPNNIEIFKEKLAPGPDHFMMIDKNNFLGEVYGPTRVPSDSLFVMGDNRDYSNDSRIWGFVPFRNVKGKAMVIWLSLWLNFSEGQFLFRPSRIGTILN